MYIYKCILLFTVFCSLTDRPIKSKDRCLFVVRNILRFPKLFKQTADFWNFATKNSIQASLSNMALDVDVMLSKLICHRSLLLLQSIVIIKEFGPSRFVGVRGFTVDFDRLCYVR